MNPKFILVSEPGNPLVGTFVYGMVDQHKDLLHSYEEVHGYVKIHGGGWYHKDDHTRTMCLYGSSGDYGEPQFCFLDRIPAELKGYDFTYSAVWGYEGKPLNVDDVEWI